MHVYCVVMYHVKKENTKKNTPVVVTAKRKYQKNTPLVSAVNRDKEKIPKQYASSGDRKREKKQKNLIVLYEGSTPSRGK